MKKPNEYQQFIEWTALPARLRSPREQKDLAKKLEVDSATLSDWKKREDFWQSVKSRIYELGQDKTSDVVDALYRNIMETGNPSAIKLWFETFEVNDSQQVLPPVALVRFLGEDPN